MIICSCAQISDRDLNMAVDWMRASDKTTVITPRKVYRALGKVPECGGCMKLFVATLRANPNICVPVELQNLKANTQEGLSYEGRPKGSRVSQQSVAR